MKTAPNPKPSKASSLSASKTYSVTQYATALNLTRQAVLWQCNNGKLANGATAQKVGSTWVISTPGLQ
jgi:hypothetical protein